MPDELNSNSIEQAITNVRRFTSIINSKLPNRTGDGAVSACSKYLHFHSRAHPLYDNNARTALPLLFSTSDWRLLLEDPARERERDRLAGDMKYPELCAKEFHLLKHAFPSKDRFQNEVKQLDHYLIALYRREWPEPGSPPSAAATTGRA